MYGFPSEQTDGNSEAKHDLTGMTPLQFGNTMNDDQFSDLQNPQLDPLANSDTNIPHFAVKRRNLISLFL